VEDASNICTSLVNCFECANLPGLLEEEIIDNLTFAVIGAGATGIEFAAELRNFEEQDGPKYYPNLLKDVWIKVIEASSTILVSFDKELQQEAIAQMQCQVQIQDQDVRAFMPACFKLVELLLDSSVKEVTDKLILVS
jgi:NADH dehydrogenase FAD-containing subunit